MKIELGIKGRYRLMTKKQGEITQDTGWFSNLITDNGMDLLATNTWFKYLSVGAGSTTPAYTDTALVNRITTSGALSSPGSQLDTTNNYVGFALTATFATGSAAGTVAEVGIGSASNGTSLFSRALIVDDLGNPTTITVLSDEDLVVVYELWIKQPTEDFVMEVAGKTCTLRAALINTDASADGWGTYGTFRGYFGVTSGFSCWASAGNMGALTGAPVDTWRGGGSTITAYTPGSWSREVKITWAAAANGGDYKSFCWYIGPTRWQMQLDTPITKAAAQTLRLGLTVSWSRDSGPA